MKFKGKCKDCIIYISQPEILLSNSTQFVLQREVINWVFLQEEENLLLITFNRVCKRWKYISFQFTIIWILVFRVYSNQQRVDFLSYGNWNRMFCPLSICQLWNYQLSRIVAGTHNSDFAKVSLAHFHPLKRQTMLMLPKHATRPKSLFTPNICGKSWL